jgi:hypothetical protein
VSGPELIIVRSLTDSDMGLFAAHRKATASRQRAIALTMPAAERLLHPDIVRDKGGDFDCICLFGPAMNRDIRRVTRGSKNWRLGGGQLDHEVFRELDSKDFALLRSVPLNDGSSPLLLTFVGRRSHRLLQAGLASSLDGALLHNVAIFEEGHDWFGPLGDLFPSIPARVAVRPPIQQPAFL